MGFIGERGAESGTRWLLLLAGMTVLASLTGGSSVSRTSSSSGDSALQKTSSFQSTLLESVGSSCSNKMEHKVVHTANKEVGTQTDKQNESHTHTQSLLISAKFFLRCTTQHTF